VKFTSSGAIQPFILPADSIMTNSFDLNRIRVNIMRDLPQGHEFKLVAVGVADTGCGLSKETLDTAKAGLINIDSRGIRNGAKNSGFGLYMVHQLADALHTKVCLGDLAHCRGVF